MFDQLLFPTDGSDGASIAFDHVLDIAAAHDATVHILHVANTTRDSVVQIQGDVIDVLEREGERIVRETADRAHQRGVDVVTEVLQGEPYSTITDYADTRGVDLVVMPTHGRRGLERLLLGSTTERVVRRADTPVLTTRPDNDTAIEYPYQNILVPTDGSEGAEQALTMGIDVAKADDARLHLLSVIAVSALGVDVRSDVQANVLEENAARIIDDAAERAENAGIDSPAKTIEHGSSVHTTIRTYIEEHSIDLVVVGTHGRTGLDRYVLGSVAEKLVRTSPIPVLTVRKPATESS